MDYKQNLDNVSKYPRYYLGQEIDTPEGKGIIVSLCMPSNGLYISPERSSVIVWYGCNTDKTNWVQQSCSLSELDRYNLKENHG